MSEPTPRMPPPVEGCDEYPCHESTGSHLYLFSPDELYWAWIPGEERSEGWYCQTCADELVGIHNSGILLSVFMQEEKAKVSEVKDRLITYDARCKLEDHLRSIRLQRNLLWSEVADATGSSWQVKDRLEKLVDRFDNDEPVTVDEVIEIKAKVNEALQFTRQGASAMNALNAELGDLWKYIDQTSG